jgi:hypothetical protein
MLKGLKEDMTRNQQNFSVKRHIIFLKMETCNLNEKKNLKKN